MTKGELTIAAARFSLFSFFPEGDEEGEERDLSPPSPPLCCCMREDPTPPHPFFFL